MSVGGRMGGEDEEEIAERAGKGAVEGGVDAIEEKAGLRVVGNKVDG